MQVNRITLDRELGLIHLETGPGGDGNYVLLPLPIPELVKRYIDTEGWYTPDTQPPEETIKGKPTELAGPGVIEYPGGWRTHPDQTYEKDYFEKVAAEKAAADEDNAKWPGPQSLRGGIKYPNGPVPKPVTVQAPPAEVPKSAKPGCQCGAHEIKKSRGGARRKELDGQLLGTPDVFPVLAFVRKAKYPTWYVTVPSVARLRIDGIHSDSIHLIPGMVRAEIDKLTGRQVSTERIHLVFPHETGSEL